MDGTCSAKTCKSGSDMVITSPRIKLSKIITDSFLDWVIQVPTLSPIGVIESSTPRVKNIIPATKSTAPSKNAISMLGDIGAIVKQSTRTMPIIGITAFSASFNFSCSFVLYNLNSSPAFLFQFRKFSSSAPSRGAISPLLCRSEIRNSSAFQLHCYGIRLFRILPHFLFSISLYSRSIITLL